MNGRQGRGRIFTCGMLIGCLILGGASCAKRKAVSDEDTLAGAGTEEVVSGGEGSLQGMADGGVGGQSLSGQPTGVLEDVFFDLDRYNLRPEARETLRKNYTSLQGRPRVTVIVEGHCDERGTVEYNLALGQRRAEAAREYLISLGMAPSSVTCISYGEERPLDPGHNEAAWARNRRAATVAGAP